MAEKEGPRSLLDQLERLATADVIVDLESAYHQAARPGAEALLLRGATVDARTIPDLDDPREIAAVAAAIHLRTVDLLEFWEPLLAATKSGQSSAPLRDLRTAIKQARALEVVVAGRKKTKARDAVLKKTIEAAERLEQWLPKRSGSTIATKYSRGAFDEEDEEGDGTPKVRPPPDPKAKKKDKPETPLQTALGWLLTIAALVGMGYGGWYVLQQQGTYVRDTAYFNAVIVDVADKTTEADSVTFTMSIGWLAKPRAEREAQIAELRSMLGPEEGSAVQILDSKGGLLADVDPAGAVTWRREELNAAEMLETGVVPRDPIGESAPPPTPTPDAGPEGVLEKPMTAEELRKAGGE